MVLRKNKYNKLSSCYATRVWFKAILGSGSYVILNTCGKVVQMGKVREEQLAQFVMSLRIRCF